MTVYKILSKERLEMIREGPRIAESGQGIEIFIKTKESEVDTTK